MRDTGLRRECTQIMPRDVHLAMSTSGMREQSVHAATFHSGSKGRPNFVNQAEIKN